MGPLPGSRCDFYWLGLVQVLVLHSLRKGFMKIMPLKYFDNARLYCHENGSLSGVCHLETGLCDCKPQVTGQQCDQCLPGYYGLDTGHGCVPCNCSVEGSTSDNCTEDGQCPCVPGVGGKTCDRCSHGLYGYQDGVCTPCDCAHTQNNCDPDSGECLFPPHTRGLKCEECEEGYWNLDPERGYQACNCSVAGSTGPQYDVLSGQCHCKEGFGGQSCDQCSLGYRRFPDCVPCGCDPRGTLADTCDLEQGLCSCTEDSGACSCKIMLAPDQLLLHVVSQSNLKGTVEGVHFQDSDTLLDAEAVRQHVHGEPFYWQLPKQFEGDENCLDHMTGDHCEMCTPGFYGKVIGLPGDCTPCTCPHRPPFSPTCVLEGDGGFRCDACIPGYEGQYCERCTENGHTSKRCPLVVSHVGCSQDGDLGAPTHLLVHMGGHIEIP